MSANDTKSVAEAQVRNLIEHWASAVSSGDRAAIMAHHSAQMLMFDLPPPLVRGIEAYARTWDFFFAAPKGPISFIPSDLEVTAGEDVAFASCLIHCEGTSAGPVDLRLTVGLRKIDGEWVVMHEHHSVPSQEGRFADPSKDSGS